MESVKTTRSHWTSRNDQLTLQYALETDCRMNSSLLNKEAHPTLQESQEQDVPCSFRHPLVARVVAWHVSHKVILTET